MPRPDGIIYIYIYVGRYHLSRLAFYRVHIFRPVEKQYNITTAPTCRGRSSKDTAIKTDDRNRRRRRALFFLLFRPLAASSLTGRRVQRSTPIVAVIWLAQTDLTRHAAGKRDISFVLSSSVLFCDPRSLSNIGPRLFVASRCRRYFRINCHSIDALNTWAWLGKLHTFRRGRWGLKL